MGREFTNALQKTPLWCFALKVYSVNKTELLVWQDSHKAHVNDLIAIAYCVSQGRTLTPSWWQQERLVRLRALIVRIRSRRRTLRSDRNYNIAKELELNLEGLELMLLQNMMQIDCARDLVTPYEKRLPIKKGALAPLIEKLIVSVN